MMPDLIDFLRKRLWVRQDTLLVRELAVNGRRVDLVSFTRTRVTSAFELKVGGFARVLEQAHYNRQAFDRSWVVVPSVPKAINLAEAEKFGVGVIVIAPERVSAILHPGRPAYDRNARQRVRAQLLEMVV